MSTVKTGILVDHLASMGRTPEDEIKDHIREYSELLRPRKLKPYRLQSAHGIKPGTKLVLFDYGGIMSGYGCADLVASEARALLRWAVENPSGLVVVVSSFTYRNCISYEMEEMGLTLPNVVCRESIFEDPIPLWFREEVVPSASHSMAGLMPVGGTLPDAQWFKPRKSFVKFFAKAFCRSWDIYEVGAGMGHTSKALTDAGIKRIVAIDANSRPGAVYEVVKADATDYDYKSDATVLICRPCHGMFCEAVIHRALSLRVEAVVYVGLGKNAARDLGKFCKYFKVEMENAGEDRESVYVWRPVWNQQEPIKKPRKAKRKCA